MTRLLFAFSIVIGLVSPVAAASPEGVWEIEMRDSRYEVRLCGDDGKQLCATLIWLGNGADNEENLPYLNTLLIDHAKPVGPGKWEGELSIYGQKAGGKITQVSDDQIAIEGCVAWVICRTYQMYRYTDGPNDASPSS